MIETLLGASWGLMIRIHANQLGKQRAFARKCIIYLFESYENI